MMVIKSLFFAGFMLVSALADTGAQSRPAMATLEVQSNFDYSLTRKEFRVHYSGLGGFATSDSVDIKIYKSGDPTPKHTFPVAQKDMKKIYQFALENTDDGKYEVEVCAGDKCSERNAALADIKPVEEMKITCKRVELDTSGKLVTSTTEPEFEENFFGPTEGDWISPDKFKDIETKINKALTDAGRTGDYQTDFSKEQLTENPQYKHDTQVFYAGLTYEIARFKKLFDKMPAQGKQGTVYADEFCERKYLLSAHAHIVDKNTKEVKHRFKTTLFLSQGGKRMYVLANNPDKVHVEMTHKDVIIDQGTYSLWITFCATEKDAIDSTFCAEPLIKDTFEVTN